MVGDQTDVTFVRPWELSLAETWDVRYRYARTSKLEVNVVFTYRSATLAAPKAAASLVRDLGARIRLVVAQFVLYALPLDRPPVAVSFIERRLLELAMETCVEADIHLYLCRERLQVLRRVLKPESLVVIGGR